MAPEPPAFNFWTVALAAIIGGAGGALYWFIFGHEFGARGFDHHVSDDSTGHRHHTGGVLLVNRNILARIAIAAAIGAAVGWIMSPLADGMIVGREMLIGILAVSTGAIRLTKEVYFT